MRRGIARLVEDMRVRQDVHDALVASLAAEEVGHKLTDEVLATGIMLDTPYGPAFLPLSIRQ